MLTFLYVFGKILRKFKLEHGSQNEGSFQYLCPIAVAYIGLGAVAAAVMSSTDSSLLSAASLMTGRIRNLFKSAAKFPCINFAFEPLLK